MINKPNTLKGIGLMALAMAVLPFLDVLAKKLGQQQMPIVQIVWGRLFIGALLTMPIALRITGPAAFRPQSLPVHVLRGCLLASATFCFFFSLKFLPIADALAIFFVQPLIVTLLSPLVLGETVGWRRWVAVAIGFCGTLIIIRPGLQALNPGILLALGSGFALALYLLLTRKITGQAHAIVTTFQTNMVGSIILTCIVPFAWIHPTPVQWAMLAGMAFIAVAGHYLIVRAYDHAEASLLAPLAYTEMIMAVAAGWYFFGDFPDRYTFLGVAILIGCAIYISMRERGRMPPAQKEFEQP